MRRISAILIICFFSALLVQSQSNAYAKFDSKGSTIGLYNLLPDATGCEDSRIISGAITKVSHDIGDSSYSYTFVLNSGGKRSTINLIISDGEILQPAVEDILTKNRRVHVRARQCGSGGFWTAEEIRRVK
jgi:hypothetical protein